MKEVESYQTQLFLLKYSWNGQKNTTHNLNLLHVMPLVELVNSVKEHQLKNWTDLDNYHSSENFNIHLKYTVILSTWLRTPQEVNDWCNIEQDTSMFCFDVDYCH